MKKKLVNILEYKHEQHPFHIVDTSPWPILTSFALYNTALGFIMYFHYFNNGVWYMLWGLIYVSLCLTGWFYDVIRESTFQGFHTRKVQQNIYLGMLLFILSEVMFFFSFFWAFFHFTLSPSIWIGGVWPPQGIVPIDPWALPFINTALLLTSGIYITVTHRSIRTGNYKSVVKSLSWTIVHGVIFSGIQLHEYREATFSINDSVYGSIFYLMTGFHGIHVLVGTIFLIVCFFRHVNYHFWRRHHVGLVCAIWYWHFVDIVWVLLYLCVYHWGGGKEGYK